jgi:hypothetical protein
MIMRSMKVLITLLSLFLACSLMAQTPIGGGAGGDGGGPKQSWQDIYRNPNLSPKFPTYDVQGRPISYHHLCLMGERVRTKYKHVINSLTDYSKLVFDYLVTDRVREIRVCRDFYQDRCIEWNISTIEIPLKNTITVYKKVKDTQIRGPIQWTFAFEKDFELNECSDE